MTLFCNLTARLKNAIRFNQKFIFLPKTALCVQVLKLMCLEGFISKVVEVHSEKTLKIFLKYNSNGTPAFTMIKLLSTPGKTFYLSYLELTKLTQGVGTFFISTNEGLLTNHMCLKRKIGGTALCYII